VITTAPSIASLSMVKVKAVRLCKELISAIPLLQLRSKIIVVFVLYPTRVMTVSPVLKDTKLFRLEKVTGRVILSVLVTKILLNLHATDTGLNSTEVATRAPAKRTTQETTVNSVPIKSSNILIVQAMLRGQMNCLKRLVRT
jgi:hypothetical protein